MCFMNKIMSIKPVLFNKSYFSLKPWRSLIVVAIGVAAFFSTTPRVWRLNCKFFAVTFRKRYHTCNRRGVFPALIA